MFTSINKQLQLVISSEKVLKLGLDVKRTFFCPTFLPMGQFFGRGIDDDGAETVALDGVFGAAVISVAVQLPRRQAVLRRVRS